MTPADIITDMYRTLIQGAIDQAPASIIDENQERWTKLVIATGCPEHKAGHLVKVAMHAVLQDIHQQIHTQVEQQKAHQASMN